MTPLATLRLEVDLDETLPIGFGPDGDRGVAFIAGGRLEGERIAATVLGGEDWYVRRDDGSLAIDVRLTLHTDDDAFMTLAYTGELTGTPEALAALGRGEKMRPGSYEIAIEAIIGCGHERYEWLDGAAMTGIGEQAAAGPVYRLSMAEVSSR
jgi:hypothetical protein